VYPFSPSHFYPTKQVMRERDASWDIVPYLSKTFSMESQLHPKLSYLLCLFILTLSFAHAQATTFRYCGTSSLSLLLFLKFYPAILIFLAHHIGPPD